jgi:hypothetical protein
MEKMDQSLRARILAMIAMAAALSAADPLAEQANRKIELIQNGKARPGSVLVFTAAELNAFARVQAHEVVPEGLRQPKLQLGDGIATGEALVDFLKLRHSAGVETNWLIAKLIQGEKRVSASVEIQSKQGRATVHLTRAEIGGLVVSGATLDFLINAFLLPLYPNAKIDEPFELAHGVDRIEVTPAAARVYMRK